MSESGPSVNVVYKSICQGFSVHPNFPDIYLKHFDSVDLADCGEYREEMVRKYVSLGAKKQDDILEEKIDSGDWKDSDEKQIKSLELNISLMREKRGKASLESQLVDIDNIINEYNEKLDELLAKKNSFFVNSAEHLADGAITDFTLAHTLYKDVGLTQKMFNLEEVEHFEASKTRHYVDIYVDTLMKLTYQKIKETAVSPKFYHFFKNSSAAESFFGRSGKNLTRNQVLLFDCAQYFNKLLEEIPDITDEERSDPDKIEKAFILNRNQTEAPVEDTNLRSSFAKAKSYPSR